MILEPVSVSFPLDKQPVVEVRYQLVFRIQLVSFVMWHLVVWLNLCVAAGPLFGVSAKPFLWAGLQEFIQEIQSILIIQ